MSRDRSQRIAEHYRTLQLQREAAARAEQRRRRQAAREAIVAGFTLLVVLAIYAALVYAVGA